MAKIRIIHYINQFFGQIGGEEKADIEPLVKAGPVGPASILEEIVTKDNGEIVATVICGDNYIAENPDKVAKDIINMINEYKPELLIAGPAYEAGRYGIACGQVCLEAQKNLGIPAVTGMHVNNPGVAQYRSQVYIIETGRNARSIRDDLAKMWHLGMKLVSGTEIGTPKEDGYFYRGFLKTIVLEKPAGVRAVDMLLKKLKGEHWETEIHLPEMEVVAPAPAIKDLKHATIALVTDGGLSLKGNPDHLPNMAANFATRIPISGLTRLTPGDYEVHHGGYNTVFVYQDPNRLVPVDVLREMEGKEFGHLHETVYSTCGLANTKDNSKKVGKEIAAELKQCNVQGVILTST